MRGIASATSPSRSVHQTRRCHPSVLLKNENAASCAPHSLYELCANFACVRIVCELFRITRSKQFVSVHFPSEKVVRIQRFNPFLKTLDHVPRLAAWTASSRLILWPVTYVLTHHKARLVARPSESSDRGIRARAGCGFRQGLALRNAPHLQGVPGNAQPPVMASKCINVQRHVTCPEAP